jgi:hypothetical protein
MNFAAKSGSGAMKILPSFINTSIGIQKLIGGKYRH